MSRYNTLVNLTQYPVPALVAQRRMTAMFSDTPGETIQPYPYWLDDVIPVQRGIKSVAWSRSARVSDPQGEGIPATLYYFPVKDSGTMHGMFTNNKFQFYNMATNQWETALELPSATRLPSRAYVRNESYLFVRGRGLYKVTEAGLVLQTVDWGSGVPAPTDLIGCASNAGYLVLYSAERIYWSSPTNPLVFEIQKGGVSTGAGSALIQGLQGEIITIEPISGGALVYTNQCAFSMRYTSNALNPWAFAPVAGCAGIIRQWHIATTETGQTHFIWSVAGLQSVAIGGAQAMLPEFTAYFAKDELHFWNDTVMTTTQISTKVDIKVTVLANNMLAFSVGPQGQPFEYCWLFDLQLGRWGRVTLKHWHIDVLVPVSNTTAVKYKDLADGNIRYQDLMARTYASLVGDIEYSSERPLRFSVYGSDGYNYQANFADMSEGSDAVVVIGDFRLTFNRMTELNEILLNLVEGNVTVTVLSRETGINHLFKDTNKLGRFLGRVVGSTLTIVIRGDFELTDVLVRLTSAGISN